MRHQIGRVIAGSLLSALLLAACGAGGANRASTPSPTGTGVSTPSPSATESPSAACAPQGRTLSETATSFSFTIECLAAPAGKAFTIVFTNKDQGIPHNVAIATEDGTPKFHGEVIEGPKTTTYHVDALPAGTYAFHCDVHPSQMQGTFVVA